MWREAEARGRRETIIEILQARFDTEVSRAVAQRLEEFGRADQLTPVVRLAATCASLEDFAVRLTPPKNGPGKK
jgi:hypothetical protein